MRLMICAGWAIASLVAASFRVLPPDPPAAPTAEVRVRVRNVFGAERLQLHQSYTTLPGDVVELTRYAYYLSNLRLQRADGTEWREPRSWHLLEVDEDGTSDFTFVLAGVPVGEYTAIGFAVGLDSLVNHGPDRAGPLNPDFGMFWQWESDYVFLKCEGYFQKPARELGAFVYHVARDGCYRPVTLPLAPGQLVLSAGAAKTVEVTADARQLFGGFPKAGLTLKLAQADSAASIMAGRNAAGLADNYARMFSVGKVLSQ
ncbi:MbnP family protein [Hymenobacter negativus]|uniref:Copper-binding protein MbnP-like domain-containing protein n=1 Tax=Hymenobacter negativus TaxID=2795026 RepID=A0ABS0QCY4_9BACT|nr:MbnP family protein [Hymenobacter negativus]MBH8560490.1 hypothetical protein [Hymenobacter negativus]